MRKQRHQRIHILIPALAIIVFNQNLAAAMSCESLVNNTDKTYYGEEKFSPSGQNGRNASNNIWAYFTSLSESRDPNLIAEQTKTGIRSVLKYYNEDGKGLERVADYLGFSRVNGSLTKLSVIKSFDEFMTPEQRQGELGAKIFNVLIQSPSATPEALRFLAERNYALNTPTPGYRTNIELAKQFSDRIPDEIMKLLDLVSQKQGKIPVKAIPQEQFFVTNANTSLVRHAWPGHKNDWTMNLYGIELKNMSGDSIIIAGDRSRNLVSVNGKIQQGDYTNADIILNALAQRAQLDSRQKGRSAVFTPRIFGIYIESNGVLGNGVIPWSDPVMQKLLNNLVSAGHWN